MVQKDGEHPALPALWLQTPLLWGGLACQFNLGKTLREAGDREQAGLALERALELLPDATQRASERLRALLWVA